MHCLTVTDSQLPDDMTATATATNDGTDCPPLSRPGGRIADWARALHTL